MLIQLNYLEGGIAVTYYYMNNPINVTEEAKFIGQALTQYKKLQSGLKDIQERNKKAINNLKPELRKDNMDLFNSSIENLCQETELFMTSVLRKLGYKYTITDNGPQLLFEYPEMIRPAIDIYSEYNDRCEELIKENASQEELREYYRNNRGRFVGGGFGVKGAVKGALFAGATNAAVGAGYGLLNCIANTKAKKQLEKEILAHTKTAIRFVKEMKVVENVTKCCEAVYIEIISNDLDNISFQRCINENKNYNQEPYYSNYEDPNQILMDYIDTLEKHPYLPISYKAPFLEYGDHNNELRKLANDFNVDFSKIVRLSLENHIEDIFTNSSVDDLVKNIDALYDKYGYCAISQVQSNLKHWNLFFTSNNVGKNKGSFLLTADIIYILKEKYNLKTDEIAYSLIKELIRSEKELHNIKKLKELINIILSISDKLELNNDVLYDDIIKNILIDCIYSAYPISKKYVLDFFDLINGLSQTTKQNFSYIYDIVLSKYISCGTELSDENISTMLNCLLEIKDKYGINTDNYITQLKNYIIEDKKVFIHRNDCTLNELYYSRSELQKLLTKFGFDTKQELETVERKINKAEEKEREESLEKRTVYDISDYKDGIFIKEKKIVFDTEDEAQKAKETIENLITVFLEMDFSKYDTVLISQKNRVDEISNGTTVGQFLIKKVNSLYTEIEDKALTYNGKKFNSIEELENEKKHYVNGKRFETISEAEKEKSFFYDGVRYSSPQEAKLVSTEMSIIKEINQTTKNSIERLKQYRKHIFKSKTAWDNIISTENNIINNIKSKKSEHRKKTASNIVYAPFYVILRILHYVFWVLFFVGIIATIALFFINKVFFFIAIPATILSFVLKNVCDVDPPSFDKNKKETEITIKGNRVYFNDDTLNENMNNTYR